MHMPRSSRYRQGQHESSEQQSAARGPPVEWKYCPEARVRPEYGGGVDAPLGRYHHSHHAEIEAR